MLLLLPDDSGVSFSNFFSFQASEIRCFRSTRFMSPMALRVLLCASAVLRLACRRTVYFSRLLACDLAVVDALPFGSRALEVRPVDPSPSWCSPCRLPAPLWGAPVIPRAAAHGRQPSPSLIILGRDHRHPHDRLCAPLDRRPPRSCRAFPSLLHVVTSCASSSLHMGWTCSSLWCAWASGFAGLLEKAASSVCVLIAKLSKWRRAPRGARGARHLMIRVSQ